MTRPSETITAAVGSIVGAVLILVAAFTDFTVSTEVAGAITLLVAWIATGITYLVVKRQKAGTLTSGPTGEVLKP